MRGVPAFVRVLIAACARRVPDDKAAGVGSWSAPGASLTVAQDGTVRVRRACDGATATVDAPLQPFDGDDFRVGTGPFSTSVVVGAPPRFVDGQRRMSADGVELARSP